jgi:hypothetical protein
MGKTLTLKTPPEIPEHNLIHARNIHLTTYSINKDSLVLQYVTALTKQLAVKYVVAKTNDAEIKCTTQGSAPDGAPVNVTATATYIWRL